MMNTKEPTSLDEIRKLVQSGYRPKYVFFWDHKPRVQGEVDEACLSQWWPAKFTVRGVTYPSAEHYLMAEKARLFGDSDSLAKILNTPSPSAAKRLGRAVVGFNEDQWQQTRVEIAICGNMAKFTQNSGLRSYLKRTKKKVLVEASTFDSIWGIGLSQDSPDSQNPLKWRGLNLLGFALMVVRSRL